LTYTRTSDTPLGSIAHLDCDHSTPEPLLRSLSNCYICCAFSPTPGSLLSVLMAIGYKRMELVCSTVLLTSPPSLSISTGFGRCAPVSNDMGVVCGKSTLLGQGSKAAHCPTSYVAPPVQPLASVHRLAPQPCTALDNFSSSIVIYSIQQPSPTVLRMLNISSVKKKLSFDMAGQAQNSEAYAANVFDMNMLKQQMQVMRSLRSATVLQ
jgi:hypothetical protein